MPSRSTPAATEGEGTSAQRERDNLLSKAYSRASRDLREAHPDEFAQYMEQHTSDLGVEWKRKPTAEEKAEREFDALLEQFPHLRDRLSDEDEDEDDGE